MGLAVSQARGMRQGKTKSYPEKEKKSPEMAKRNRSLPTCARRHCQVCLVQAPTYISWANTTQVIRIFPSTKGPLTLVSYAYSRWAAALSVVFVSRTELNNTSSLAHRHLYPFDHASFLSTFYASPESHILHHPSSAHASLSVPP